MSKFNVVRGGYLWGGPRLWGLNTNVAGLCSLSSGQDAGRLSLTEQPATQFSVKGLDPCVRIGPGVSLSDATARLAIRFDLSPKKRTLNHTAMANFCS